MCCYIVVHILTEFLMSCLKRQRPLSSVFDRRAWSSARYNRHNWSLMNVLMKKWKQYKILSKFFLRSFTTKLETFDLFYIISYPDLNHEFGKGTVVRKLQMSFVILFRFCSVYIYYVLPSFPFLAPANLRQSCIIVLLEGVILDVFTLPFLSLILSNSLWLMKFHGSAKPLWIFHSITEIWRCRFDLPASIA